MNNLPAEKTKKGGTRPNAGRKSKAEEMGLKQLLDKCWTEKDRGDCIKTLASRASKGKLEPIKLLMAYTFGKPKESVEYSGELKTVTPILNVIISGEKSD